MTTEFIGHPDRVDANLGTALPKFQPPRGIQIRALWGDDGYFIGGRTYVLEVWNANPSPLRFNEVSHTGPKGFSVVPAEDPVIGFSAYEIREFLVTIPRTGPDELELSIKFSFETAIYRYMIKGRRVVALPFPPDWSAGLSETWTWDTEAITSFDNSEQRLTKRAAPRRTWDLTMPAEGVDRARLENILWASRTNLVALPLWDQERMLDLAATAGSTKIRITDGDDIPAGYALIWLAPSRFEVVKVKSTNDDTATLYEPLRADWPRFTHIYPLPIWSALDTPQISRQTPDFCTVRLSADERYNPRTEELVSPASDDTLPVVTMAGAQQYWYRRLPVLEDRMNWASACQIQVRDKTATLSNDIATDFRDYEGAAPTSEQDFHWFLNSHAEINRFRAWLRRTQGAKPFWLPTGAADFIMVSKEEPDRLVVEDTGMSASQALSDGRRDLRIELYDGTILYARIRSVSRRNRNTERLHIETSVAGTGNNTRYVPMDKVSDSNVRLISFLVPSRLALDKITLDFKAPFFATCSAKIHSLYLPDL